MRKPQYKCETWDQSVQLALRVGSLLQEHGWEVRIDQGGGWQGMSAPYCLVYSLDTGSRKATILYGAQPEHSRLTFVTLAPDLQFPDLVSPEEFSDWIMFEAV